MKSLGLLAISLSMAVLVGCNDEPDNPARQAQPSASASNVPPPPPPPATGPNSSSAQASPSVSDAASDADLPTWRPDSIELTRLGDYVDFEKYQIRIPKGYEPVQSPPAPPGAKAAAWAGSPREDGSRPMVMIMLMTPPPGAAQHTLQEVLEAMVGKARQRRDNWQQTAITAGRINGMKFVTTSWQGQDQQTKSVMHGIEYATEDGSSFVAMRSQDFETHLDALKTGNASLQTFRKK